MTSGVDVDEDCFGPMDAPQLSMRACSSPESGGGHGWDTLGYAGPEGNVESDLDAFLKAND
jgi:hypothetical protein